MYYFHIIMLKNCPYTSMTNNFFKTNNIKYISKIINDKEKHKYKNNNISTFPQIYLKRKYKNGSLLIGGYSDFKNLFQLIKENDIDFLLKKFNKKYSKKTILRLIQLIK